MAETPKPHPLLQKPLFIYSLPTELLNSLALKGDLQQDTENILVAAGEKEQENSITGPAGCVTCGVDAFLDVSQQREHVRSDLHKFNLKRKLTGQQIVNAEEFEKMLDGIHSFLYR